jgi:tetratricopeptide (TPR) repeat protein
MPWSFFVFRLKRGTRRWFPSTELRGENPTFAPSYFLRGQDRDGAGTLEAALRDFQKAAQLDAKYALPHYKIAQILLRQGKSAEAEAARKKFFELGQMREEELLVRQTQDVLMRKASRQAE